MGKIKSNLLTLKKPVDAKTILSHVTSVSNSLNLDLEKYEDVVNYYAQKKLYAIIGNDFLKKAIIIFKHIFALANTEVNIFTKALLKSDPEYCLKRNYLDTIINLHYPFWVNFDTY
ncbi:MAG: hypothetical protein IPP61_09975 [Cytophagaceae bacterium]|nr:hypothetical protein [Cytophagaceae bacterium]MBL0325492.1 hypothetical protein [Cytophagaceae bacterium]